jgi:hypothetical protein
MSPKSMKKIFIALLLLSSESGFATDPKALAEAYTHYRKGAYAQAIATAEKQSGGDAETQASVAFFIATAHAKMQAYDKAVPFYAKAEKLGYAEEGFHYDFGQALFASQRLKDAEAQFKQSILKKYKTAASAYYVGFIRQTLDDHNGAVDFYNRIERLASDPDKVKQPALYQIAEIAMDKVNDAGLKKEARLQALNKDVLHHYKRARDFEDGTPTAEQAAAKVTEIENELSALVERMRNGVPLPKQAYSLRLSQEFGYDSNVVTSADEAITQISHKSSFISKTSLLTKYQFNFRKTWSLIPELSTSATLHSRRSTPNVFQNDNITIAPALRTKFEHMSRGQAATMLFDVEFNLMLRDYQQQHHFPYYSRYFNFMLGERLKWFDTGTTTIKASIKFFESYDPSRNSYSPSLSIGQNIKIFGAYDLQNTFTADYLTARNDFNDERNYKLKHNVTFSKLFWKLDFTPSLSLAIKDTLKQKGSRGNEVLFNPSFSLMKELSRKLEGNFEYAYSKNYSKSKTSYQYTKHELKLSATAKF